MYHFIINPKSSSGRGIRFWWLVKDELDAQKIEYTEAFTEHVGHAAELSRSICRDNPGIKNIVVVGGDGTVNEVINGIDNFDEVLIGYIPSGSSNDLARGLNLPNDPVEALRRILKPSKFKYLDFGQITFRDKELAPRKFTCSSGIGYDAGVCYEVQESSLKKSLNRFRIGKFVYIAIALKQVFTTPFMSVTITVDDVKKLSYSKVLLISNMLHKYEGGGLLMAPDADPTDGKLSITLVHGLSRAKILLMLPTIFNGTHIRHRGVETFHCKKIEIKTDTDIAVHTDGEIPAICSHIVANCIPGRLRMIL